jgi:predicted transcriptional regulator
MPDRVYSCDVRVAYGVSVKAGEWTFLSNYGHVLVSLAHHPDARMRDIAAAVGITERAVQQIVRELVNQGYVEREKVGRRNRYRVVRSAHFRHEIEAGVSLGSFLDLVSRSQASPD